MSASCAQDGSFWHWRSCSAFFGAAGALYWALLIVVSSNSAGMFESQYQRCFFFRVASAYLAWGGCSPTLHLLSRIVRTTSVFSTGFSDFSRCLLSTFRCWSIRITHTQHASTSSLSRARCILLYFIEMDPRRGAEDFIRVGMARDVAG